MMSNGSRDDFDRLMVTWMESEGRIREPEELIEHVLDQTRIARRRPRWLVPEWWFSLQTTARLGAMWRPALVVLVPAVLLLAAAFVAILVGGSRQRLPAPFGPAGNGSLIWDAKATIYVANANGTSVRPLVASVPNASGPSISPDGLRVAFWGNNAPDSLFVANIDGSGIRRLADGLWIATDKPPAWSPDSRHLAVATESGPDRKDEHLVVFDVESGETTLIGQGAFGGSRAFRTTWSPDGQWIGVEGFDAIGRRVGFWIGHADGSGWHRLPTSRLSQFEGQLQWAPNSLDLQVAYTSSSRDGDAPRAMVLDLASGNEREMTSQSTKPALWVAWSPDGTRLAWLGGPSGDSIVVTNVADPTDARSISARAVESPLAWSPDGGFLIGTNLDGTKVIAVPVDGTSQPVVIPRTAAGALPVWQRVAP